MRERGYIVYSVYKCEGEGYHNINTDFSEIEKRHFSC